MSDTWYLLTINKPSRWKEVRQILNLTFGIENVWLPTQKVERPHIRKKGNFLLEQPLYPGYIFLKSPDMNEALTKLKRLECGVYFINGTIPEEQMSESKSFVDSLGVRTYASNFKVGEKVRISSGPFVNFTGMLLENSKGHCKVELTVFGRTMPLAIAAKDLIEI